ncbi:MAG: GNAT family N-acetyltransferase, partial [Candidatus Hodarchaeales archaeon]
YEAFINGKDRTFLDQSENERQEYFKDYYDRSRQYIKDASIVLKDRENHKIVGISMIRPREEDAHLALLATHPAYQRRGLGEKMLRLIVKKVEELGFKTMSLGVDQENTPALNLYQRMGFKSISHIITYCWKPE